MELLKYRSARFWIAFTQNDHFSFQISVYFKPSLLEELNFIECFIFLLSIEMRIKMTIGSIWTSQAVLVVKKKKKNTHLPMQVDVRDVGSIPGSGRSPGGGHRQHTALFLPGDSHGQRSLAGCSTQGPESQIQLKRPSTCTPG